MFSAFDQYSQIVRPKPKGWVVFSMQDTTGIEILLNQFSSYNGKYDQESTRACCATVIFTGEKKNIRIKPFHSSIKKYGIVLNPQYLETPDADFYALGSNNRVRPKIKKRGARSYEPYDMFQNCTYKILTSKYPNKTGYMRPYRSEFIFIPNQAAHRPIAKNKSVHINGGSIANFAMRIDDKYEKNLGGFTNYFTPRVAGVFAVSKGGGHYLDKNGHMMLNEALTYQNNKGENPIDGLILTGMPSGRTQDGNFVIEQLIIFLKRYPHLKLYFYDINAPKHIVRCCDNQQAIVWLEQVWQKHKDDVQKYPGKIVLGQLDERNFQLAFNQATPCKGFVEDFPEENFVSLTKYLLYCVDADLLTSLFDDAEIAEGIKTIVKEYYDASNDTGHLDIKALWQSIILTCQYALQAEDSLNDKTKILCEAIVNSQLNAAVWPDIQSFEQLINAEAKREFADSIKSDNDSTMLDKACNILAEQLLNSETSITLADILHEDSLALKTKVIADTQPKAIGRTVGTILSENHFNLALYKRDPATIEEDDLWHEQCLSLHASLINMHQDYIKLGRKTHRDDIRDLIDAVAKIINVPTERAKERYKQIMEELNRAFNAQRKKFTLASYLPFFNQKNKTFDEILNDKAEKNYCFPRMLRSILRDQELEEAPKALPRRLSSSDLSHSLQNEEKQRRVSI